jgi:hypothetical protein
MSISENAPGVKKLFRIIGWLALGLLMVAAGYILWSIIISFLQRIFMAVSIKAVYDFIYLSS